MADSSNWKPQIRNLADVVQVLVGLYLVIGTVGNYRSQQDAVNRLVGQVKSLEQRILGIEKGQSKVETGLQVLEERVANLRGRSR